MFLLIDMGWSTHQTHRTTAVPIARDDWLEASINSLRPYLFDDSFLGHRKIVLVTMVAWQLYWL